MVRARVKMIAGLGAVTLSSLMAVPMAYADCGCGGGGFTLEFARITGGGWINPGNGGKESFGFNVSPTGTGNNLTVHLEYNDHLNATDTIQIHADGTGTATNVIRDATGTEIGLEFLVSADVRAGSGDYQEQILVTVVDRGEPGTNDTFQLHVLDGPEQGYSSGQPIIDGGNIQMHY